MESSESGVGRTHGGVAQDSSHVNDRHHLFASTPSGSVEKQNMAYHRIGVVTGANKVGVVYITINLFCFSL